MVKADTDHSIIIYDNKFYCLSNGNDITVYDLSGTKTKIRNLRNVDASVQCIVDDKIYYVQYNREKSITSLMRCRLNGGKKEKLLDCSGEFGDRYPESMKMDEEYIYLLWNNDGYNLVRIPLYGGKIEKVAEKTGGWFELSEDNIFFLGAGDDDNIYKLDKDMKKEPKTVTEAYYIQFGIYNMESVPFYYADGHLLVQGYKRKERKLASWAQNGSNGAIWADVTANYAPDWYWVSEAGEIEDTIKGSGLKKKWKKAAERALRDPMQY